MKLSHTMLDNLKPALRTTLFFMLACGIAYPLVMTGLSQVIFPSQANGSLVEVDNKPIGSNNVGQDFSKPYFLKGRPSYVHYNTYIDNAEGKKTYLDGTPFTGVASGSQNLGPTNPLLVERVQQDMKRFLQQNPEIRKSEIPTDLLTSSGSGLDPHISVESALIQLPAISKASGIPVSELRKFVDRNTTDKLLGLFGERTVNVLGVNKDIAQAMHEIG